MPLIAWNDSYSVKVRQFDEQHKGLINSINQLHEAMRVGKGSQVLGSVLASLAAYTQAHFSDEEQVMMQYNYPGYVLHKKLHDQFVERVRKSQKDAEENKSVVSMELMTFLKDWLLQHIQGEDAKYGPYLNGKGVA